MPTLEGSRLGQFLRDRRAKLDPAEFGFALGRRRTPGLRREEVALRANISPAWYAWLEQGRGGAPSAEVLGRIARALILTEIEREHLFLIGLGRLPEVHYRGGDSLTERLQRLLDALPYTPAIVKTATWDVLAWNRAASLVLTDYGSLPPERRNILRILFGDQKGRPVRSDWVDAAPSVVAAFRIDVARAGAEAEVTPLIDELCAWNSEFAAIWRENSVQSFAGIVKRLHHPVLGQIALEYSSLAIDGRPDLAMAVYNPITMQARVALQALLQSS